nr:tol-Pal system protein TolA-like [Aegilops tauschii subsp. strangulata]
MNVREAREEREEAERQRVEAAKAAQEEADATAKAHADAAAKAQVAAATKAQADAAAKAQAEEAAHGRTLQLIIPLRFAPLAPEILASTGGAGDEQPIMERGGGDPVIMEAEVTPPTPTTDAQTRAKATLQQRLGEAQTVLRTKEECNKAAQERDRLVKELADKADHHEAALQKAKDSEASLLAKFETERSALAETEKALNDGYGQIEDMLDEYFPGHAIAASQAVKARRNERRQAGAEIAPNAPRTLCEQLLAVQARL